MKYWEIIADNLSRAGWSLGCVSAMDSNGERLERRRTSWSRRTPQTVMCMLRDNKAGANQRDNSRRKSRSSSDGGLTRLACFVRFAALLLGREPLNG